MKRGTLAYLLPIAILLVSACAQPPRNRAPVPRIAASPDSGSAPLEVRFSSAGSADPDGEIVAYSWNFGDGSEVAEGPDATHTYNEPGDFTATLEVTDTRGGKGSATVAIVVQQGLTLASRVPINLTPVGDPIAVYATGEWDDWQMQEPGEPVYDPVTSTWICVYAAAGTSEYRVRALASVSSDGKNWTPHPQNPISGTGSPESWADDPYIAKDSASGTVWRDSAGRALMFAEERLDDGMLGHRGVRMWRSDPNTLDNWTLFGQVLDRGTPDRWDATDRPSPTIIFDGTRLVMLFEGRNLPAGQEGEIGMATSTDEGVTWSVHPDPIVERGASGWNQNSIVPDDVIKIGDDWVLLTHGQALGGGWTVGRYVSTDDPTEWTAGSFTELPGNPLTTATNTAMAWGNNPRQVLQIRGDQHALQRAVVSPR